MPRLVAPLALALAGLVLFGHGGYIHAKALLAQVLLERAFTESIATPSSGQAMVMGRHLAGRAHRGEAAATPARSCWPAAADRRSPSVPAMSS